MPIRPVFRYFAGIVWALVMWEFENDYHSVAGDMRVPGVWSMNTVMKYIYWCARCRRRTFPSPRKRGHLIARGVQGGGQ